MSPLRRAPLIAAALFSLLAPGADAAQRESAPGLLVTATWLNSHLQDRNLVVLSVGPGSAYSAGHIPGARAISVQDIVVRPTPDAKSNMLPDSALKQLLEQRYGISSDSRVVVSFDSAWFSAGTRVLLTLQYAGLGDHAMLLDGGMDAWRKAGFPISKESSPPPAPGRIATLSIAQDLIVTHEYVASKSNAPKTRVIDAREAACFAGGCRGHIPGATSIPMEALIAESGLLKSKAELATLFQAAGVRVGDTVVAYCHNGFRSTAVILAARLLGHPVKNYDGSFSDWSRRNLPVEGGK